MFKRNVLFILCSFSLLLGLVFIMNSNLTFATDSNTYYARDLQEGDILPVGATIVSDVDYYYISSPSNIGFYLSYIPSVEDELNYDDNLNYYSLYSKKISGCFDYYDFKFYYEADKDRDYCISKYGSNYSYGSRSYNELLTYDYEIFGYDMTSFYVNHGTNHKVMPYTDLYDVDSSFDGDFDYWKVSKISGPYMYLEPTNNVSVVKEVPSTNNDYEFEVSCADASVPEYNWYKYKEITNYSFKNSNNGDNNVEWVIEDGIFSISGIYDYPFTNSYSVLSFEFEAQKDDILLYSSVHNYLNIDINLGDVELSNNDVDYSDNHFYVRNKFTIDADDAYVIAVNVSDGYNYSGGSASFKTPSLLSPINTGAKLDQSLVSEGDVLYYEAVCENGYILGEKIEYIKPVVEDKEETDNVVDDENVENDKVESQDKVENPNTFVGNMFILFVIVLLLSLGSLVIFDYKRKSLK